MSELYFLDFLNKLACASIAIFALSLFALGVWILCYEITTCASEKEKQGYLYIAKFLIVVIIVSAISWIVVPSNDLINYEIKQIKKRCKK